MKNIKSIIALIALAITVYSCTKTIEPPLVNSPPQLVIEGAVSDTAGPYHVTISKSVDFYADNTYPGVSGATVTITDQTEGVNDVLTETSTGTYTTHNIVGKPGNTYRLTVLLDGKTYTSISTMPYPVALDSITFDYTIVKNLIQPVVHFQDPAAYTNYYKFGVEVNGVKVKRFQTFDDRLSNGKYINTDVVLDTGAIKKNDLVNVSLVATDKGANTFLSEAENIAFYNSDQAAPATPTSNITGGCLGYFSAQTVSSKKRILK